VRERYGAVKRVAVVQYGVYTVLGGTAGEPQTKTDAAATHVERFASAMADTWQVMPITKVVAHPAYGKPQPERDGWFTGRGMRFFVPPGDPVQEGAPHDLKSLCKELGVDGVITVSEAWNVMAPQSPMTVRSVVAGRVIGFYFFALYACDGTVVWNDSAQAESTQGVTQSGIEVLTPAATWLAGTDQTFEAALGEVRARLKSPPRT
jgi:hypothetical protein